MSASAFTTDTTEITREFFASHSTSSASPKQKLDQEDIVFSTDAEFNFMRILPFAQQFFSLSQQQGEGQSALSAIDTSMLGDAVNEIKSVLATQSYWRGMVPFKVNNQVVWKDTFVRPIFRKSRVVGTQWLLSNTDEAHVTRAKAVYAQKLKASVLGATVSVIAFLALVIFSFASLPSGLHPVLVVLAALVGYFGRRYIAIEKVGANDELESRHYPIQRKVFAKTSATELVDYELALKQGALYAAMSRVEAGTNDLSEALNHTQVNAEQLASAAEELAVTSEQVSSASQQMTISVEEISHSAGATANECKEARETVHASAQFIDEASDNVTELASYIAKSAEATSALVEKSESARKVSERIDSIAEQTNLLALNAAIEAARAGDSGRGFSVVADEVRALSQSTQQAVDEIEDTISAMAESINRWQTEMSQQVDLAERCNRNSERSKEEMLSMRETIESISDHMQQVATASTQNQQALIEVNEAIQQSKVSTQAISEGAAETFESVSGVGHRIREFRSITTALEEE